MQKEYHWYRTKILEEISKIKERYCCVWCPECRGSGRERFGTFFSKEKVCPRCHGRMVVAARKITGKELWKFPIYEREKIMAVRQYPDFRRFPFTTSLPSREMTLDEFKTWLEQRASEAHIDSFDLPTGSGGWALARGKTRAYEEVLNEIRHVGKDQHPYIQTKKVE